MEIVITYVPSAGYGQSSYIKGDRFPLSWSDGQVTFRAFNKDYELDELLDEFIEFKVVSA